MQTNFNYIDAYLKKQNSFKILVKDVQFSLQSKEYKNLNCSLDEFVKMKWNISKYLVKAYRYLISAKVIDQLQEFEIQPCYERICRALFNVAKTQKQMKLLWSSILKSAGNRPDSINSSHVKKMWKILCNDKKYSKICHFEDEIMNKVEKSLNKHSNGIKTENKTENKIENKNEIKNINNSSNNNHIPQYSFYPSPILNDSSIQSNTPSYIPSNNNHYNNNIQNNQIEYQLNTSCQQPQRSYYPSPIQNGYNTTLNKNIQYNVLSPSSSSSIITYNSFNILMIIH
eukprot:jgi/Orpsp1_1/1180471/evm.model.c7180000073546.1